VPHAAEIGKNQDSLMKCNNARRRKAIYWNEKDRTIKKRRTTTPRRRLRVAGILRGILERRDIFPTRGVHEGGRKKEKEERKRRKLNGPRRPVKILRWPRCFVYWSLFTRKSFMVLSHFAARRSGRTVSLPKRPCTELLLRTGSSCLKKIPKLRPFDRQASLIVG